MFLHFLFYFFFLHNHAFVFALVFMLSCVLSMAEIHSLPLTLLWSFPRWFQTQGQLTVNSLPVLAFTRFLSIERRECLCGCWDGPAHSPRQSSPCCCLWAPRVVLIFVWHHLEPRFPDGFPDRKLVFPRHLVCCPTCGAFLWLFGSRSSVTWFP